MKTSNVLRSLTVFLVASACMNGLKAQEEAPEQVSGTVIYEQVMKLDIQLEGDASQFAHALPKERKTQKILRYTSSAALFENHAAEDPEEMAAAGGEVMIKMQEPDHKLFFDLEEGRTIEQKDFMSRVFLIEKESGTRKWKMTGQQKKILGYTCFEATSLEGEDPALSTKEEDPATGTKEDDPATGDRTMIHAWFAPGIGISAGPGDYAGLPGLVLEVVRDQGDFRITALSVERGEVDSKLMKKPTKGKKVTQEEYQAIVDEKLKEMGVEGGAGGGGTTANFVIKIED